MPLRLLPLAVCPAILLPLAVYAFRHRRVRGAIWYCLLLLAIALWSAAYAWELAAPDFAQKLLALRIKYVGVTALPVAFIGFVLDFVARDRAAVRRTTWRVAVGSGCLLLAALTNEWHELFWGRLTLNPAGALYTFAGRGPGFYINVVYTYAVLFAGLAILVAQAVQSPYLYRKRAVILVLAVVLPWLGNVIFVSRSEAAGTIDSTPFLFTCTAIIAAVAVFRYRVLEPIPTLLDARIEVIGDGFLLVDRSLRIADLNRAAEAIIRRDRAAAAGERIERVLRDWPASIEGEVRQDLTLAAADGTRTYDVRITPIESPGERSGYVVLLRDVTEHRLAEAALRDSELRYRGLVENARDLICTCDLDGHILAINEAGLRLTGYAGPELAGRKLFDPDSAEATVVTRDGRTIVLELASWPQYRDGVPIAIQAIGRDVTERRRLEEDLRQAQKMESVGKLAGGIAHDFNNLLTAIIGYAALAEAEQTPGTPLQEWIEQIRRSGEQAATLTSQLLAFGRRQVLRPVDLDLNTVVDDIQKMLRRLIGERIELVVQLAPDLARVRADRSQIEQVIVNLVVNARDAMPLGGRLTISTHNAPPPGGYAALSVDDSGEGIAPEILERIFEPFFTTKPVGRGTGLGLATVYGIVKQSGGDIQVQSAPARGARFTVLLPTPSPALESPAPQGMAPAHDEVAAAAATHGATVLLVEDDPGVRAFAAQVLRDAGTTVLEAGDAAAALAIAAARDSQPLDLLLTDVVLPGIDGADLAGRLRGLRPGLRVLFMSGHTPEELLVTAALASGDVLMRKPFLPATLRDRVAHVLAQPSGIGT
ncbi:MAG TPA: histidine kinase N-terminal 7TM domain-containing protein [Vicinamibacterales bacterium]|jgi:signal transduction histidine kinase|nr:histidine kinase N-terminal 7TM domain-containing protein [Vicinamibacterales bacterium]